MIAASATTRDQNEPTTRDCIPLILEVGNPAEDGYHVTRSRLNAALVPDMVMQGYNCWRRGIAVDLQSVPFADTDWRDFMEEVIQFAINDGTTAAGLELYDRGLASENDHPLGGDLDTMSIAESEVILGYIAWAVQGTQAQHEEFDLPWPPPTLRAVAPANGDEREAIAALRAHWPEREHPDPTTGVISATGRHWREMIPVIAAQVTTWHTIADPAAHDDASPSPG